MIIHINWDICQVYEVVQNYRSDCSGDCQVNEKPTDQFSKSFFYLLASYITDLKNLSMFHVLTYFLYYLADVDFERTQHSGRHMYLTQARRAALAADFQQDINSSLHDSHGQKQQ